MLPRPSAGAAGFLDSTDAGGFVCTGAGGLIFWTGVEATGAMLTIILLKK